jgi:hypothetical protein
MCGANGHLAKDCEWTRLAAQEAAAAATPEQNKPADAAKKD